MTTALKRFIVAAGRRPLVRHADQAPVRRNIVLARRAATARTAVLDRRRRVVAEDRADAASVRANVGAEGLLGTASRRETERARKHQDGKKRLHPSNDGRQRRWVSRRGGVPGKKALFSAAWRLIRDRSRGAVLPEKSPLALTRPDRPSTLTVSCAVPG